MAGLLDIMNDTVSLMKKPPQVVSRHTPYNPVTANQPDLLQSIKDNSA